MPFTDDEVRQLLEAFERSEWEELRLVGDGITLVASKSGATTLGPVRPAVGEAEIADAGTVDRRAPTAPREPQPDPGEALEMLDESHAETPAPPASTQHRDVTTVLAPSLGLFWRSPKPGAPPFVEVGGRVEPDSTVCIVEVMKLMNHVKAGSAGIVSAVHVTNGDMVEYGQPLMSIVPE